MSSDEEVLHSGRCHCGKVRFEVRAKETVQVVVCNCSICEFKQGKFFIVPKSKFRITAGSEYLTTYTFNTHQARHTFCSVCGVQAFYYPRSNPDGVSVAPYCITSGTIKGTGTNNFDGQNWEASMDARKEEMARMSGGD